MPASTSLYPDSCLSFFGNAYDSLRFCLLSTPPPVRLLGLLARVRTHALSSGSIRFYHTLRTDLRNFGAASYNEPSCQPNRGLLYRTGRLGHQAPMFWTPTIASSVPCHYDAPSPCFRLAIPPTRDGRVPRESWKPCARKRGSTDVF